MEDAPIRIERPRELCYPFIALVELTDLESGHKTMVKIDDLSLHGCHITPANSSPTGACVWLQITHNRQVLQALGRVANVQASRGMGIRFTSIHERDQALLEKWVTEARHAQSQRP